MVKFKYYTLRYNMNKDMVESFNIFDNTLVNENVYKEVRKYVRLKNNYKRTNFNGEDEFGFKAFCNELDSIIRWQESGRVQYEMYVGGLAGTEKWDCYMQVKPNIEMLAREVIWQYNNRG